MDLPRLLIADGNEETRQILFDMLCQHYCIKTCRDGIQALALLHSFQPQYLLLDLMLPGLDGLSLLQRAVADGISPATLAFLPFHNTYMIEALSQLNVFYLMTKPCDPNAVAERLADYAARQQPVPLPAADLQTAASNILLALGFSARLDGFLYLQAGIPLYLRDPVQSMTKELYVAIGKCYGKDAKLVERSIRGAIQKAWESGDPQLWQQFFSRSDGTVPRPSNHEFLRRIAHILSQQGYGAKHAS